MEIQDVFYKNKIKPTSIRKLAELDFEKNPKCPKGPSPKHSKNAKKILKIVP